MSNSSLVDLAGIVKEIRETIDWLIKLPNTILSELDCIDTLCGKRKKRIETQIKIAKLREFAKSIQRIYFFKGSLTQWAHSIVNNEYSKEEVSFLREFILEVVNGLKNIREAILDIDVFDLELSTSAMFHIDNLIIGYEKYLKLTDREIVDSGEVVSLLSDLEKFQDGSRNFVSALDDKRRILDCTY